MNVVDLKNPLLNQLAKAYPKQARNLTDGPILIRVDDRDAADTYPGFCDIHLRMSSPEADRFTLVLDNVPFDNDVKSVADELEGIWQSTRTGERLTLNLTIFQKADLRRLAAAIRKVVGRGKTYLDKNWKWIAPRTAASLERLTKVLPFFH
jgi:hypothetical protein